MDILYQYYFNLLEQLGINQSLIIIGWLIIPFCLAILAFFVISILIMKIEKFLIKLMKQEPQLQEQITNVNFKNNKISFLMIFIPTIFLWGLVPYSNKYVPVSSEVSLLLFISSLIFLLFAFLLILKTDEEKKAEISFISNILNFILPILFSILSVVLLSSSLNLNEIVLAQSLSQNTTGWIITPAVFGFFVFILGTVGILILLEKKIKISELSLFNVTNKQAKLLILAYYSFVFMLAVCGVCLFLGGYLPPLGFYFSELYQVHYIFNNIIVYLEQIFWLFVKSIMLSIFIMGLKIKNSELKEEKLVRFAWYILFPISFINLLICMFLPLLGVN